ncbi:MAG: response regulator [Candidatus Sericytochromatia bacterium]
MYNKVAIIDDDPINNLICEKVIQRLKFAQEVISFLSAVEALAWFQVQPCEDWPTLVFLDINLPFLDGWEFLSRLEALPENPLEIYILSSSVSEEDQTKALAHPLIAGFLIKPLTLDKLTKLKQVSEV